jgi:hypothetical protein
VQSHYVVLHLLAALSHLKHAKLLRLLLGYTVLFGMLLRRMRSRLRRPFPFAALVCPSSGDVLARVHEQKRLDITLGVQNLGYKVASGVGPAIGDAAFSGRSIIWR